MIVDCHVHLNNYHETTRLPTADNIARLTQTMDACAVDHAVVITSYKVNDARPSVEEVLENVAHDSRFTVVAGLGLMQPTVDWSHLQRRLKSGEVKGLKLYPGYEYFAPSDKICESVYELAEKFEVPVMIHTGDTYSPKGKVKYSHPMHVDEVAVDWPNVNFVICHLGNPWLRTTAELLYKNENVYADVSGLTIAGQEYVFEEFMLDEVKQMIRYMGEPDKLLFGTDWPICDMKPYVDFIEKLVDDEYKEAVMGGTARRLFKIGAQ